MAIRYTAKPGCYGHFVYQAVVTVRDIFDRDREYRCSLIATPGFKGDPDGLLNIEANRCTFSIHLPLEALQALRAVLMEAVPGEGTEAVPETAEEQEAGG